MGLAEAFAVAESHQRESVRRETWGHLAPEKDRTYKGRVLFAVGCFGSDDLNPTVIASDFEDLSSSPWYYDALHDFIGDLRRRQRRGRWEEGCVYEFKGTFLNYEFDGTLRIVFKA